MHMVTKIKAEQLFLLTSILTEDMRAIHRKHFVYLKKANPGQKKMCLITIHIKKISNYILNKLEVGGQITSPSYWKNYHFKEFYLFLGTLAR